jgi:hypothetical protein
MPPLTPAALTARIETAFEDVWRQKKGVDLPGSGADDRRLLFAAVAGGLLAYLKDNEDLVIDSLKVREAGGDERTLTVTDATLDIGT